MKRLARELRHAAFMAGGVLSAALGIDGFLLSSHFIDGGVCSNDPMLPAFVEADKEFPGRPVLMVSLGTGNLTDPLGIHGARRWGAVRWATQILDVLMDGQSGMSENCLDHLVKSRERPGSEYFRLQPDLPPGLGRLDDTSERNVAGLQEVTAAYCRDQSGVLDAIAATLRTAGHEALTS